VEGNQTVTQRNAKTTGKIAKTPGQSSKKRLPSTSGKITKKDKKSATTRAPRTAPRPPRHSLSCSDLSATKHRPLSQVQCGGKVATVVKKTKHRVKIEFPDGKTAHVKQENLEPVVNQPTPDRPTIRKKKTTSTLYDEETTG